MAVNTKVVQVDPFRLEDDLLRPCAEALRQGRLVAFPTETVYGLGANALLTTAVEKIYAAKGRPQDNPIIVHVSGIEEVSMLVTDIPDKAQILMERFWPGPLTLLFPKSPQVPDVVTAGLPKVAIRMPDHPVAQRLIYLAGVPVAAPSANISGKPSPVSFAEVYQDLFGRVDYIVDGGPSGIGVESTVLDVSGKTPVIFRPGGLSREEIESVLGPVEVATTTGQGSPPPSPGMKYRHYAPKGQVIVARGTPEGQRVSIVVAALRSLFAGHKVLILSSAESAPLYERLREQGIHGCERHVEVFNLGSRFDLSQVASRLFSGIRYADVVGASMILAESFPRQGLGLAVENRLDRASGNTWSKSDECLHLVFVCSGNTCRSPMSEALFRDAWAKIGAPYPVRVSSFGTSAVDGLPATPEAVEVMRRREIDLSSHRSKGISAHRVRDADLIITMASSHKNLLVKRFPEYPSKIYTLSEVVPEVISGDVRDPFGMGLAEYEATAVALGEAIQATARLLARPFI